ncbi:MAG TPA: integration host factor subunit alpha [Candidatus Binataceae bacterium]|nr:integration host factor subunit alpha [Candidatus Binataceae bacterium]
MTKADLVERVYERTGISRKAAGEVVDTVFDIIKECLSRGETVKISRFGTFVVLHKRERRGRNPQTGDTIIIGSRCVLSFKPSGVLKERLCDAQ